MLRFYVILLLCLCFCVGLARFEHADLQHHVGEVGVKKIAIIGAGIGGSSAAYFLKEKLGDHTEIHVFEKNPDVGGRVRYIDIKGARVEMGGSIYHVDNKYFASFIEKFGLEPAKPRGLGTFGIWNGEEFLLEESEWAILTLAKLLYRYGLDYHRVKGHAEEMKDKLLKVYEMLDEGVTFNSTQDMLSTLGLFDVTQQHSDKILQDIGASDRYINELVVAIHRVNYGQNSSLNGLAGLVSLIGSGDNLFSVKGGNAQVIKKLLEAATAAVRTRTTVTAITKLGANDNTHENEKLAHLYNGDNNNNKGVRYLVKSRNEEAGEKEEVFDYVVIATPLELTDIEFSLWHNADDDDEDITGGRGENDKDSHLKKSSSTSKKIVTEKSNFPSTAGLRKRPYQTTWTTFVVAEGLNPKFFGRKDDEHVPTFIFTTESPAIPFSSVAALRQVSDDGSEEGGMSTAHPHPHPHPHSSRESHTEPHSQVLYKMFSRNEPSETLLDQVFKGRSFTLRHEWKAYPVLQPYPAEEWPAIVLDRPGIYYINSFESAVSTIETTIIASKNVVNLILKSIEKETKS